MAEGIASLRRHIDLSGTLRLHDLYDLPLGTPCQNGLSRWAKILHTYTAGPTYNRAVNHVREQRHRPTRTTKFEIKLLEDVARLLTIGRTGSIISSRRTLSAYMIVNCALLMSLTASHELSNTRELDLHAMNKTQANDQHVHLIDPISINDVYFTALPRH